MSDKREQYSKADLLRILRHQDDQPCIQSRDHRPGDGHFGSAMYDALAHLCRAWQRADLSLMPPTVKAVAATLQVMAGYGIEREARQMILNYLLPREQGGRGTELLEAVDAWMRQEVEGVAGVKATHPFKYNVTIGSTAFCACGESFWNDIHPGTTDEKVAQLKKESRHA